MGASWASGIRLYACVATLGLLQHFKLTQLPGSLESLGHPWVIGVALFLFLGEFLADKVPVLDSGWDAVHTFIRIPAGIVLASTAFAKYPPHMMVIAGLIGGTLALTSHTRKSTNRLVINHSPEPVSNWTHSLWNDISGIGIVAMAPFFPIVTIGIVIVLFVISAFIIFKALPLLKKTLSKTTKSKK
jgi:hypothetical protein